MNFYITYGTHDFLKKIKEKYSGEKMLLLSSNENASLVHETSKKTVFNSPKKFEEIVSTGDYSNAMIAALTYIPVSKEGEPIIEYLFKKNMNAHGDPDGFIALRALKPLKSDTYLVITFWDDLLSCQGWINAINQQDLPHDHFMYGIDELSQLSKKPYTVTYSITK